MGIAAAWLHRFDWKAATGSALLSGITVGEGIYGLTAASETTSPVYWILISALGIVLLAWSVTRRAETARVKVVAIAMASVIAMAFNAAYIALGTISQ